MWRSFTITRLEAVWVVFIVEQIVFVFGVALLIGVALARLPALLGTAVCFVALVIAVGLVGSQVRREWPRLPR